MRLTVTSLQCQCLIRLMIDQGDLTKPKPTKIQNQKKKETTIERGDPLCSDNSEIPEWLQEFREKLVDDEIPFQRGSHVSSSHEASLEPIFKRREDLGKHNVHTHFPKDRNCEICKRTKITRATCRRRNGEAVPRAVNFGDLLTAHHKVLSDNGESRNNHRYAVVVQDLATQWIQAYPCKNKTSQETQRSLQMFLEPERKPKVIYTDNSLEFGKACEDLSWNHCTSTLRRSETNAIAEREVRRVKEGTSAVLLQSGLNESWWSDSMECYTYLRNVTDLLSKTGEMSYERRYLSPRPPPKISLKHDHNWTKGNDQSGSTVERQPVGKLVQQSFGEALRAESSKPTQCKPNPICDRTVKPVEMERVFVEKGKTSHSQEIVGKWLQEELGSSDRRGKLVKCEENRVMSVDDRTGKPVESSTHTVQEFDSRTS